MQRGMAQLPDLAVSDSSEAMLSGRKPPFRLLVRAVHDEGRRISIRHAVSEGFVVSCPPPPPPPLLPHLSFSSTARLEHILGLVPYVRRSWSDAAPPPLLIPLATRAPGIICGVFSAVAISAPGCCVCPGAIALMHNPPVCRRHLVEDDQQICNKFC